MKTISTGKCSFLLIASLLAIAPDALAQLSASELATLKGMEEKLFFKDYPDDKTEARLVRIEKRVFGDSAGGGESERLSRLSTLVKPAPVQPAATPSATTEAPAQNTTPRQAQPPARYTPSADDMRRRVMQAKEEEVGQLQSEAIELWKAKRGNEALEKFEQVVRIAPDFAEAHFSLGVIYEAKQDYKQALQSYKRALELIPNKREYAEAVNLVSKKAHTSEGDLEKKQELKALAEQASAAYRRGEFQSALQFYKEMDKKAPKEALVKFNIATIYLAMKNPVEALDYFKAAARLKPDETRYREAVERLEGNLARDKQASKAADSAWQNPGNDSDRAPKQKKQKNKRLSDSEMQMQNQQVMMQQQRQQQPMMQQQPQMQQQQFMRQPQMQPPQVMQQMGQSGGRASSFGIIARDGDKGTAINAIGAGSKAGKAGLQRGDIIRAVDGVEIKSANDLEQVLGRKQPNESSQFIIERNGQFGQFVF